MEKFMARMEGVFKWLVPICYMLGLIVGTAYYFTDGAGNLGRFLFYVGGCLAVATELHSFLLQIRVRVAWTKLKKATDPASEDEARNDLRMYGGWLAALLAFQIFTSIMYRASSWTPPPSIIPGWLQIVISGAVIPVFFFGVSFLANVATDPKDVQEETQRTTSMESAKAGQWVALRALRAARRSFEYRLRQAEKSHADLTGLAVSMQRRFADDDGAQTLIAIDSELREVEGQGHRKYAGVWQDPDVAAKAQRQAVPGLPVAPAPSPVSPPPALVLPDLTKYSDADLNAYAASIEARAHEPSQQGPAFAAELLHLGQELARRRPDRAGELAQSMERMARSVVGHAADAAPAEPGRVRRPTDEELDAMARDLGGMVI